MRNYITPVQQPLLNKKTLKVSKKALLITSVLVVAVLCSG
jgi:hypothetical protein